jgi:hypothetical protein
METTNGLKRSLNIFCILLFIFISGTTSIIILLAMGQEASALDENNCLSCHNSLNVVKTTGDGRQLSLRVMETDVDNSVHKFIDCTTCHRLEKNYHSIWYLALLSADCLVSKMYEAMFLI